MSVGAILTLGLGSFGSVNLLPTLGYLSSDTPPVVLDTHDGERDRRHSKARDKRYEEYRKAREELRAQIAEAFEIATGEARIPEPAEVVRLERKANKLPKAERPEYRRQFLQIHNYEKELAEINRILIAMDDEDIFDILSLL